MSGPAPSPALPRFAGEGADAGPHPRFASAGRERPLSREAGEGQGGGRAAAARSRRVLLLGGVAEARALAARIAADPCLDGIASLAGRTSAPAPYDLPTRIGGFGGADGLARYLIEERIDFAIDATHPFAARMSENARLACAQCGVPLLVFTRAPWARVDGDQWIEVADNANAVRALGEAPRRVFLTIGRHGVAEFRAAPQHDYLLRVIEEPDANDLPPRCEVFAARRPFSVGDEIALMREKQIDIVVSKNSGGPLTHAKIEAARALKLPVVMIAPPPRDGVDVVHDIDAVMAFLAS